MIAKRVPAPKNTKSIKRLVKYIADPAKQTDFSQTHQSEIERLGAYVSNRENALVRISHCSFDDVSAAVKEMAAIQSFNTRSTNEKTYHLVVSFPEGEEPSLDILNQCEDYIVERIGFAGHQRISAVHTNTDNLHIHIAINKVHPENFTNVEPYYDKFKMLEACRELEKKFGLQVDRGATSYREKPIHPMSSAEEYRGEKSFVSWIREHVEIDIIEILNNDASTWSDLHQKLSESGVCLRQRGAGLVFQNMEDRKSVKASSASRKFSKSQLESKLGAFEENQTTSVSTPKRTYVVEPLQNPSESCDKLWQKYCDIKDEQKERRTTAFAALKQERSTSFKKMFDEIKTQREEAYKSTILRKSQKRRVAISLQLEKMKLEEMLSQAYQAKSQVIKDTFKVTTWTEFLQMEAERGDEGALQLLREGKKRVLKKSGNSISGIGVKKDSIFSGIAFQVNRKGQVLYTTDHGNFTDYGQEISINKSESKELLVASLQVAIGKFGRNLNVNGDKRFVEQVKKMAWECGLRVCINGDEVRKSKQKAR